MPSKLGFGNTRTPMTKKMSYGSAMHYKNPVKKMDKKNKGALITGISEAIGSAISGAAANIDTSVNKERA
jgi:hypothetical protein